MPPTDVHDQGVIDSLATIQAQLSTIQGQLAATPTPSASWSVYSVPVSSPTNTINLRVDHSASVGDLVVSSFLFLALFISVMRILFNGLRGVSV